MILAQGATCGVFPEGMTRNDLASFTDYFWVAFILGEHIFKTLHKIIDHSFAESLMTVGQSYQVAI